MTPTEQKRMLLRPYLAAVIFLGAASFLAAAAITYFALTGRIESPTPQPPRTLGDTIRAGTAAIPAYSTSTAERLAHSHGFQALISYTDLGFEPMEITIHRGNTVRFTNNSSNDVWIAASGQHVQIYPRTSGTCGSSSLDSCAPFAPQDFWEFSFDTPGNWQVVNNLDKSRSAMVRVQ
jgi:plastocyanin